MIYLKMAKLITSRMFKSNNNNENFNNKKNDDENFTTALTEKFLNF